MADDQETGESADNIISLEEFRAAHTNDSDGALDDDELIRCAGDKIAQWKTAGTLPSFTAVQKELFHKSICAGASAMARDKIIEALIAAFDSELGSKRGMIGTWVQIAKDYAAECAQDVRENTALPELTPG